MFKLLKKNAGENDAVTILGKGMKIEAKLLSGNGIVRIEGEYYGELRIDGDIVLAKSGYINGDMEATAAYISGRVNGNIKCSDILHIKSTGKINGDIECEAILMDEGAVFIGHSKMSDRDPLGLEE